MNRVCGIFVGLVRSLIMICEIFYGCSKQTASKASKPVFLPFIDGYVCFYLSKASFFMVMFRMTCFLPPMYTCLSLAEDSRVTTPGIPGENHLSRMQIDIHWRHFCTACAESFACRLPLLEPQQAPLLV